MACILQVTGLLLDGYPIWVNNKIIPVTDNSKLKINFPSKKVFFYFLPMKRVQDTFQKQFGCSPILFFWVATGQNLLLARPPVWTAIEGVNFTDLSSMPECNDIHLKLAVFALATSNKNLVFSQFTDKIWKLYLNLFLYQCDQRRPFSLTLV